MKNIEKKLKDAIKKNKEASELFENECCSLCKESGNIYAVEQINFDHGMRECVSAISKLISDCVVLEEL